jgi:hypothetical protein
VKTEKKFVGFPAVSWEEEEMATRPMALHEMPREFRIDHEMAIVARHHERVEKAIRTFWGHRDCDEYLQQLILKGCDGGGNNRVGFKPAVLSALMNLASLHKIRQPTL